MASFSIQTLLGLDKDTPADQHSDAAATAAANPDSAATTSKENHDVDVIDVESLDDCEPVTVDVKTVQQKINHKKRAPSKRPRQEDDDSLGNSPEENPSSPTSSDSDGETSTLQGSPAAKQSSSDESATSSGDKQKAKRLRTAFTVSQLRALEYSFRLCPYPDSYGREQIAKTTGIDEAKIQVWFQNRRARYRKREKPLEPPQKTTPTATPHPTSPSLSSAMFQAYYATAAALHHHHHHGASPHSSPSTPPSPFFPPSPWYHHMTAAANPYTSYFSFPSAGVAGSSALHYNNTGTAAMTKKFTGNPHRSPQQ